MTPMKTCPKCSTKVHISKRVCPHCQHIYYPNKPDRHPIPEPIKVEQHSTVRSHHKDEQVLIQECFPPGYLYLGFHEFRNVELKGEPVTIYVGKAPGSKGEVFQFDNLRQLVSAVWNDVFDKTSN